MSLRTIATIAFIASITLASSVDATATKPICRRESCRLREELKTFDNLSAEQNENVDLEGWKTDAAKAAAEAAAREAAKHFLHASEQQQELEQELSEEELAGWKSWLFKKGLHQLTAEQLSAELSDEELAGWKSWLIKKGLHQLTAEQPQLAAELSEEELAGWKAWIAKKGLHQLTAEQLSAELSDEELAGWKSWLIKKGLHQLTAEQSTEEAQSTESVAKSNYAEWKRHLHPDRRRLHSKATKSDEKQQLGSIKSKTRAAIRGLLFEEAAAAAAKATKAAAKSTESVDSIRERGKGQGPIIFTSDFAF